MHTRYWDEVRDAGNFTKSIIFDPTTFGGDGVGSKKCVANGPFANYTLHLGPGHAITNHCLTRSISNTASLESAQSKLDACYAIDDFEEAWVCMEASPHRGGHGGTGGEVSYIYLATKRKELTYCCTDVESNFESWR